MCEGKITTIILTGHYHNSNSIPSMHRLSTLLCALLLFPATAKHLRTSPQKIRPPPPSLAIHEDIFHFVKIAQSEAKKNLASLASSRPDNEHRMDVWAEEGMNAVKTTIERQMQSHADLYKHMDGYLQDLLSESNQLKEELDLKLKAALQPAPMELHHRLKIKTTATDTKTPYQKIVDKADNELKTAVEAAQDVTEKMTDKEKKYGVQRRNKYHKLGNLMYSLEKSMNELSPSLSSSQAVLGVTKGDMTSQNQELKDSVAHVEHMLKAGKVALTAAQEMKASYSLTPAVTSDK